MGGHKQSWGGHSPPWPPRSDGTGCSVTIHDSHKDRLELRQASCEKTFRGQIKQPTNCQERTDFASNIEVLVLLHKKALILHFSV